MRTSSVTLKPTTLTHGGLQNIFFSAGSGSVRIQVAKGGMVYSSLGDLEAGSNLYLIERGYVKAVVPSDQGKNAVHGIFAKGDIVGLSCLSLDGQCEFLIAMTPVVIWRMSRFQFMALLGNACVREEFIGYLAQLIVDQQQRVKSFVTEDSEHRFAALLLYLARKFGRPHDALRVVDVRITQEEFASMVGTTRSRIGLFLRHFNEQGAVLRGARGALAINEARLEALACHELTVRANTPAGDRDLHSCRAWRW